ncbi:MAG: radical SAM protein [Candidatus Hodarchaeota archaeon]
MNSKRTVLLLNASNHRGNLIYPYAFVQVSEIANRFNIHTVRQDMFFIPENKWRNFLRDMLEKIDFDMILITIRNTDACSSEDYDLRKVNNNYHQIPHFIPPELPFYSPIKTSKILIDDIRTETNIPITLGGFGFSIMPEKIMNYLKPDYGVIGDPDGFFEHFEDVLLKRNLNKVSNLIFFENEILQRGPLKFYSPSYRREYTDEIIQDIKAFYAKICTMKSTNLEPSIPIEIVRGCMMKCAFCNEPFIKGRNLRYRDLDVIEEEIRYLGNYGLNYLYMICSESNTGGKEYILKLADRIKKINSERRSYEKVTWIMFYLMDLTSSELKHLRSAGFLGGANDVISLDDENLAAMEVPYRSNDIIQHIRGALSVRNEEIKHNKNQIPSLEYRIFEKSPFRGIIPHDNFMTTWNLFLGNVASTPKTIRVTLKKADDANLSQEFESCYINKATRVWDYINLDNKLQKNILSVSESRILDSYNELYPSFIYPPTLIDHFGCIEDLEDFFALLGNVFLSSNHLFKKDWNWFLAKNIDLNSFSFLWKQSIKSGVKIKDLCSINEVCDFLNYLYNNPSFDNITLLFNPTPSRKKLLNFSAHVAILFILYSQENELNQILKFLHMPSNLKDTLALSPYKITNKLFQFFEEKHELLASLNKEPFGNILSIFFTEYLLYLNSVPLEERYRIFFIEKKA